MSGDHTYISLGLLTIFFIYIYVGLYTKCGKEEGKSYVYTQIFFKIFRVIIFAIITVSLVLDIPIILPYSDGIPDYIGI